MELFETNRAAIDAHLYPKPRVEMWRTYSTVRTMFVRERRVSYTFPSRSITANSYWFLFFSLRRNNYIFDLCIDTIEVILRFESIATPSVHWTCAPMKARDDDDDSIVLRWHTRESEKNHENVLSNDWIIGVIILLEVLYETAARARWTCVSTSRSIQTNRAYS